jgi:hypothetical protein
MYMKIIYLDGTWFLGYRGWREIGLPPHETKGCHHFKVMCGGTGCVGLENEEISVPITNVKYFLFNPKYKDLQDISNHSLLSKLPPK